MDVSIDAHGPPLPVGMDVPMALHQAFKQVITKKKTSMAPFSYCETSWVLVQFFKSALEQVGGL